LAYCEDLRPLSTPSLGITSEEEGEREMNWTFNSLSRDHWPAFRCCEGTCALSTPSLGITFVLARFQNRVIEIFQLPLSGSLGITPEGLEEQSALPAESFQLPLSGSQIEESEYGFVGSFQLPLSGSPSPIPGFFGSPRLSAAAPLRTDDF
jgi:hypothetical protein